MKLGIVGLLGDQINAIAKHFPHLDIDFLSRERERETASFAQRHTKVILMTKFISHSTSNAVPLHKREFCPGGMTKLRNLIAKLSEQEQSRQVSPVVKPNPSEDLMAPIAANEYRLLHAAQPGDVLAFECPKDISMEVFKTRISSIRSHYKRTHGIETSQKLAPGGTLLVEVLTIRDKVEPVEEPVSVVPPQNQLPVELNVQVANLWAQMAITRSVASTVHEAMADADEFIAGLKSRFFNQ